MPFLPAVGRRSLNCLPTPIPAASVGLVRWSSQWLALTRRSTLSSFGKLSWSHAQLQMLWGTCRGWGPSSVPWGLSFPLGGRYDPAWKGNLFIG